MSACLWLLFFDFLAPEEDLVSFSSLDLCCDFLLECAALAYCWGITSYPLAEASVKPEKEVASLDKSDPNTKLSLSG